MARARWSARRSSSHPDVDMVSFTGSTRAGTEVARNAAATVKRVHQELGGKSPNVLLEDVDFEKAVKSSITRLMVNSRPVVQCADPHARARRQARRRRGHRQARRRSGGRGRSAVRRDHDRPVVSKIQFDRVQGYLKKGIEEGAKLVTGGPGGRGPEQGLLREAHRVLQCAQRHDDRARGDLRTGAEHHSVRDGRRCDPHRQRHAVRPRGLRLGQRHGSRDAGSAHASGPGR